MSELRASGQTRLVAAGVTDVGRTREINEDNILVKTDLDLYVVADGMGGHSAGDVASSIATESLVTFFKTVQDGGATPDMSPASDQSMPAAAQRLVKAIRKANADIYSRSSIDPQHKRMGSTVVAALVSRESGHVHIAHVGDSRCYRIRGGEIEQLTRDHSLINEALALKPDLTKAQIARLPKNVITRALGMAAVVQVDVRSEEAQPGDVFLLCSDGLSGLVSEDKMVGILDIASDLREACELLIDEANEAGGTDNISVLMIQIEGDEGDVASIGDEEAIELDSRRVVIETPASIAPPPEAAAAKAGSAEAAKASALDAASADKTGERAPSDATEATPTGAREVAAAPASDGELASGKEPASAKEPPSDKQPISLEPSPASAPTIVAKAEDIARIVAEAAEIEVEALDEDELNELNALEEGEYGALGFDIGEGEELDAAFAGSFVSEHVVEPIGLVDEERGPVSMSRIARCKSCGHELYIGNMFCVECGARIER